MFVYPGNVRLLWITDDVSVAVNLPLPPVRGTTLFHSGSGNYQSYTLIGCQMMKTGLSKSFLGNKS